MRDGVTHYDRTASGIAASNSWPLHSVLRVTGPTGRSLLLEIRDTGLLPDNSLDMSEADFTVIAGSLAPGRVTIEIREVQP